MRRISLSNMPVNELEREKYHLGVFASGYEERCTNVLRSLSAIQMDDVRLFGFRFAKTNRCRLENDKFFWNRCKRRPISIDQGDDGTVYELLTKSIRHTTEDLRILVDYSSMSRVWYAAILNWARLAVEDRRVVIDFVYSKGRHSFASATRVIAAVAAIPGCEGRPAGTVRSVAIVGMGLRGLPASVVLAQSEPDEVVVFRPSGLMGVDDPYVDQVVREASSLLANHGARDFALPLENLEETYQSLAEIVAHYVELADVTLIPMGPKPHILASIVVAMRFPQVTCLRVSHRSRVEAVPATGEMIAARVTIG